MDKCALCGGNLIKKRTKVDRRKEEELFIFEDVEVEVCEDCAEMWFSSEVTEVMDKVMQGLIMPTKEISVPVWSLKRTRIQERLLKT